MCFGSPSAPTINYQGPSAEDIAASNAALNNFAQTTTANAQAFQDSINAQITAAQESTQSLMDSIAAGGGGGGNRVTVDNMPYDISTETGVEPEDAQTTTEITKKTKKPSTLKIATGGLSTSAGTGVNYGV